MKQTAVEWLVDDLGAYLPTSIKSVQLSIEQAKEMEKKQKEDFAIEFAEFCSKYRDKNRNIYGEMLHATSKYDDTYTTKQLLEIYKKEKGL